VIQRSIRSSINMLHLGASLIDDRFVKKADQEGFIDRAYAARCSLAYCHGKRQTAARLVATEAECWTSGVRKGANAPGGPAQANRSGCIR